MYAIKTLTSKLFESLPSVHRARKNSILFAVKALCRGGKLNLTNLGRSADASTSVKHSIKRIDRLISNPRVFSEIPLFCKAMASLIISPHSKPMILVDWTLLGKEHCALVASVPFQGRAITLYYEVHPLSRLANRQVEYGFLDKFRDLLPEGVVPTLVTDAGYLNPWFKKVIELGWRFVGRLTPRMRLYTTTGQWTSVRKLEDSAKANPADYGVCSVTVVNPPNYLLAPCVRIVFASLNTKNYQGARSTVYNETDQLLSGA